MLSGRITASWIVGTYSTFCARRGREQIADWCAGLWCARKQRCSVGTAASSGPTIKSTPGSVLC
jgi:hypothetical protein